MQITTIGIDIAKNVFHVMGLNRAGRVVLKKKLRRKGVLAFFAQVAGPCVVGIEACASSHYWGREFEKLGHEVRLMPPRYVKPFLRGNKNDYNDALAIAEACNRPEMRCVRIKTVEQQDMQALHRFRDALVKQRTATANQLRGLLGEYGLVIPRGISKVRKAVPLILEDGENGLTVTFRTFLNQAYRHLQHLDKKIGEYDVQLDGLVGEDEEARRLMTIPGYGPKVAGVFLCVVGDGKTFDAGREVSAYIGVVPGQHSSGDKTTLLGISKRGNRRLRTLLIHGARSVVSHAHKKDDRLSRWIQGVVERRGMNKATVALANKLARIGWAVLTTGQPYTVKMA